MKTLYTTQVKSIGTSTAHLSSSDKHIDIEMKPPVELGGPGGATNPEQLFAAAFAACLSNSISVAAVKRYLSLSSPPEITAHVELAKSLEDEYGMKVVLEVSLFNQSKEVAEQILAEAQRIWPWAGEASQRSSIEVRLQESRH